MELEKGGGGRVGRRGGVDRERRGSRVHRVELRGGVGVGGGEGVASSDQLRGEEVLVPGGGEGEVHGVGGEEGVQGGLGGVELG